MEWRERNWSVLWYNAVVSCSEHSDEQAAERRRKKRKTEVCWGPKSPAAGRLPDCCSQVSCFGLLKDKDVCSFQAHTVFVLRQSCEKLSIFMVLLTFIAIICTCLQLHMCKINYKNACMQTNKRCMRYKDTHTHKHTNAQSGTQHTHAPHLPVISSKLS